MSLPLPVPGLHGRDLRLAAGGRRGRSAFETYPRFCSRSGTRKASCFKRFTFFAPEQIPGLKTGCMMASLTQGHGGASTLGFVSPVRRYHARAEDGHGAAGLRPAASGGTGRPSGVIASGEAKARPCAPRRSGRHAARRGSALRPLSGLSGCAYLALRSRPACAVQDRGAGLPRREWFISPSPATGRVRAHVHLGTHATLGRRHDPRQHRSACPDACPARRLRPIRPLGH